MESGCKDNARIFSYATGLDFVTLETKPIVFQTTTLGLLNMENKEIRSTDKAGFDKIGISFLGPPLHVPSFL